MLAFEWYVCTAAPHRHWGHFTLMFSWDLVGLNYIFILETRPQVPGAVFFPQADIRNLQFPCRYLVTLTHG